MWWSRTSYHTQNKLTIDQRPKCEIQTMNMLGENIGETLQHTGISGFLFGNRSQKHRKQKKN